MKTEQWTAWAKDKMLKKTECIITPGVSTIIRYEMEGVMHEHNLNDQIDVMPGVNATKKARK